MPGAIMVLTRTIPKRIFDPLELEALEPSTPDHFRKLTRAYPACANLSSRSATQDGRTGDGGRDKEHPGHPDKLQHQIADKLGKVHFETSCNAEAHEI
jgi:hypothetical protein